MPDTHASFLPDLLLFLGAAVVAVPIAKRLGLGAILGYLIAGFAIGPSGLRLFSDTTTIQHIAELGVVLLLFVIGLELQLNRLLAMRHDIFGLGLLQLILCSAGIGLVAWFIGTSWSGAAIIGLSLALSATAIALQLLTERGDLQAPYGQRSFAVLLFQDISIVPILALVPLLSSRFATTTSWLDTLQNGAIMLGVIAGVILAGRFLLNSFFRMLANTGAQEVMTAAALLLVLGTALLMQWAGMSMALGAFLAGVMLAESKFRHELEADIEPFRGLLLGLFFIGVGMSIDGRLILENWLLLLVLAVGLSLLKPALVAALFHITGSSWHEAVRASLVLNPAGEFAFVLLPLGVTVGLLTGEQAGLVSALAALTLLIGPLLANLVDQALQRWEPAQATPTEDFSNARGKALIIGFGRFGQVVSQVLRTHGVSMTIIDKDVEMIDVAAGFGSKVYYGDGSRLDVLRAAGIADAQIICIAIDDRAAVVAIVEIVRQNFPLTQVFARAYDRQHSLALMSAGANYNMRETFESALAFGRHTLSALGVADQDLDEVIDDVRTRDYQRMMAQQQGGLYAGRDLIHTKRVLRPEPLEQAAEGGKGRVLNEEDVRSASAKPLPN